MHALLPLLRIAGKYFFCLLITAVCCFHYARAHGQNGYPVTLTGNNLTLRTIFKVIRQQTGFVIMYSNGVTMLNSNEKLTVNFKNTPLDDVMTVLLKNKNLAWKYNEDVLIIYKKELPLPTSEKNSTDTLVSPTALTGKVVDATGNPIPGATVQIKGTSQGTTTDANGLFSLPKPGTSPLLVISSIGYETREVTAKGKSILTQLNMQVNSLDETQVIAYGTTTRRLSTGNITTIKAADIEKQPVRNPLLALQGRVPGLFITQATGVAGSAVTVRIQGQNSILNSSEPLYVIDGVPYSSQLISTAPRFIGGVLGTSNGSSNGSPLSYINPADIESIDVLKDADATAIYGSRAANGAILITTKKGKIRQTRVAINVRKGWGQVTRKLQLLNTQQYLQMRHEAKANDNAPVNAADYDINGTWDTTRYTDWQKQLIGGTAHYTDIQASVSGGSENTQYLIGTNYHRETTVFPGNFADKTGSIHFNISGNSPDQKFYIQFSGSYLADKNALPSGDLTIIALTLAPDAPSLTNTDGSLNWAPNAAGTSTWQYGIHPLLGIASNNQIDGANLISNISVSYRLASGFNIKSSFGYTNLQTHEMSLQPLTAYAPENRAYSLRRTTFADNTITSWIIEPQLNYHKNTKAGKIDLLVGTTFNRNNSNGQVLFTTGYNSDQVLKDIKSATSIQVNATTATVYKYSALFGRLNYNWKDKYIINLTTRRDGSSRFGPENRIHNFGAIGGAWIFSEEAFLHNIASVLSFGKLRGSYGITGNDQIGDYKFLSLYRPTSVSRLYQNSLGLTPLGLTNPLLQWEKTKKLQFGIDLAFLQDRLQLTTNFFQNRSSNQLLIYALPGTTGFTTITKNFPATVQNNGWEFLLNTINLKTTAFNWSSTINLTVSRNKLLAFPGLANSSYANSLIIGKNINPTKAYRFGEVDPATGLYQFIDSSGKLTSAPTLADRTVLLDNYQPRFYGGFENRLTYKGFELSILLQFVKQIGANNNFGDYPGVFNKNQPLSVLNRWQKAGDVTTQKRYSTSFNDFFYANTIDARFGDASYIRLKNLSLTWQLPRAWANKLRLQNGSIYIQGQNLFTITNYTGLDPETQSLTSLPPLRFWTMGARLTL